MQTLLFSAAAAAQKNPAEVTGPVAMGGKNVKPSEGASSFQAELRKQVHDKKSSVQLSRAQSTDQQKAAEPIVGQKEMPHKVEPDVRAEASDTQQALASDKASATDALILAGLNLAMNNSVTDDGRFAQSVDEVQVKVEAEVEAARLAKLIEVQKDIPVNVNENTVLLAVPATVNADQLPIANLHNFLSDKSAGNLNAPLKSDSKGLGPVAVDVSGVELRLRAGDANFAVDAKGAGLKLGVSEALTEGAGKAAMRELVLPDKLTPNMLADLPGKNLASSLSVMQSQAMQFNNLNVTQQAGSSNIISPNLGNASWNQAIAQKVVWMVGAGEQSASLTLNPPDLGPLKVVIHVHNDKADTTFISDNNEVRKALETGLSNLRERMSESGVQLGQANVSTSSQSQQSFEQATRNKDLANSTSAVESNQVENVETKRAVTRTINGLVDTFA